jgi:hypothetical protein
LRKGEIRDFTAGERYGATHLDARYFGWHSPLSDELTCTFESDTARESTSARKVDKRELELSMSSSNPLVAVAPTIDSKLHVSISSTGRRIRLEWRADRFPSHGVVVEVDGEETAHVINNASCARHLGVLGALTIGRRLTSSRRGTRTIDLRKPRSSIVQCED